MSESRRMFDLSPPITPSLKVFPGDTPPTREVLMDMQRGDHLTLSTLKTTVHLGSHVDGPNHYGADDPGVEALPIELFVGRAQVIDTSVKRGQRVGSEHLLQEIACSRVLLKTGTYPDPCDWNDDFAGVEPSLVDALKASGVEFLGIDTPSVDPATERNLSAHHAFRKHGITILEGIVLDEVPAGFYELIALPLRLVGFDGSPVRAVLRELDDQS